MLLLPERAFWNMQQRAAAHIMHVAHATLHADITLRKRGSTQKCHTFSAVAFSTFRSVQASSAAMDFSMPRDTRLERKAFSKVLGFADVCRAQDAIAKRDDAERAQNKSNFQARARTLLDGQMAELQHQQARIADTHWILTFV